MNYNLKDNLKGNCSFAYFRENALWYRTIEGVLFPVPVSDLADAGTVLVTEKAMVFMRWIRKYLAEVSATEDA